MSIERLRNSFFGLTVLICDLYRYIGLRWLWVWQDAPCWVIITSLAGYGLYKRLYSYKGKKTLLYNYAPFRGLMCLRIVHQSPWKGRNYPAWGLSPSKKQNVITLILSHNLYQNTSYIRCVKVKQGFVNKSWIKPQ